MSEYELEIGGPAPAPTTGNHVGAPLGFEPELTPGTTIGKYRILFCIGAGGMAEVYLAVARGPGGFNKLLVLKLLRSDLEGQETISRVHLAEAIAYRQAGDRLAVAA